MSTYGRYKVDFSNPNSTWAIAASFVRNGSTVLDVGCAAGQMAEQLTLLKGCAVDGIEIDAEDAEDARTRCRAVFAGDVIDIAPTLRETYDHVLFLDVLEHVLDPAAALAAVKAVLSDEGSVVVSVPNMAHSSVRLGLLQGRFRYEDDGLLDRTHLRFFDAVELESVVRRAGFSVKRRSRTFHDLPREVVEASLSAVGLTATEQFLAYVNSEEAATYQYVLELVPSDPAVAPSPVEDSYVTPIQQYRHFYEDAVKAARMGEAETARAAELEQRLHERYMTSVVPPPWLLRLWKKLGRRNP